MNRLILDHFRRWLWVLALVSVLEFGLGWLIASHPEQNFEFWGLLLALWTGANLLSFDFRRGIGRAVAVLPLTARQIGRGWWLATVALPAIALAALLFLGAGTFYHFHPDKVFPADRLALACLFNVAWLGVVFTCVFPAPGLYGNGWERAGASFLSLLGASFLSLLSVVTLLGGMIYFQDASKKPFKCALLLGVGALLTVAGWFRAGRFVLGPASFRLATPQNKVPRSQPGAFDDSFRRLEALRPPATASRLRRRLFDRLMRWLEGMAGGNPRGEHHAPGGCGGIPFLISATFVRGFLYVAAMVALMALVRHWQRRMMSHDMDILLFATNGSFMSCWFIIFYQIVPVLPHLRFLRTLPISVSSLAGVMIAMAILPLIALGALAAGVAGLSVGTPGAVTVLKSYALILAPASLCVFFAVCRGSGVPAGALVLLTMFGFLVAPLWLKGILHNPEIPFRLTGAFVALCVLLAFLLTRRALLHSSRAYRVQASPFGKWAWTMGR
ncbi:MAG: hypothetical protein ABSH38_17310 [Verrucomicrobiota bacterium]|jgi:hypothetical protein